MKTIEIVVKDDNFEKVKDLLENLRYIEKIKVSQLLEERAKELSQNMDEVTLLSQPSLAEEWNSEEDDRYDALYKAKYPDNDVQKR